MTKKTDRKVADKAAKTSRNPKRANQNPSSAKKGPGRYHAQGGSK